MKKKNKIKGADKLARQNRSSTLVFDDPGAAAAYAAQEAFAAGVSPSAVMHSSPGGAGNGDAATVAPVAAVELDVPDLEEIQHSEPPVAVEEPVEAPEAVEEPAEAYEVADRPSEPLAASEDDSDDLSPEDAVEELAIAEDSDSVVDDEGDDQDD